MKEEIKTYIDMGVEKIASNIDKIKETKDSVVANAVIALAPFKKETSADLLQHLRNRTKNNMVGTAYFLIAARAMGFKEKDLENTLRWLEGKRTGETWSQEVRINSLILRALGEYGVSYPKLAKHLCSQRRSNGSWFDKIWVTSHALTALYYSYGDEEDIAASAEFLKSHLHNDHWMEIEDPLVSDEFTTSTALESLLLVGEGYANLEKTVKWCGKRITETDDIAQITYLLPPLIYIYTGRASKETGYRKPTAVTFRETKITIGTQILGDQVEKKEVVEKGAVQIKDDAIVTRPQIETGVKAAAGRTCRVCGEEVVEESMVFCPQCGSRLESTAFEFVCQFCGKRISLKKKPRFCPYCRREMQ